jgi:hypothetical protein
MAPQRYSVTPHPSPHRPAACFRSLTGEEPPEFIQRLQRLPIAEARRWLASIPELGELLDEQWKGLAQPQFLSDHDDELRAIERGYGEAKRPEDYTIVDREALDDDLLSFEREGGGWLRLNRMFGGELDGVLQQFQREVWAA